jgi:hypothetical protein
MPTDPNLGAVQGGAAGNIQGLGAYNQPTQQLFYNQQQNPFAAPAIQGAQAGGAATMAQGGANLNNANAFQGIPQSLLPFVQSTLNTGFDPQNALYGQQHQANTDFTNAALSQRGLGATPWGAGVSSMSDQYFNTNWLNTLLGRQQTAAGTAGQLLGAGEGAATTGANLGQTGAGQLAFGAAMPYEVSTGINTDLASFLPYLTSNQQQQIGDYLNYYGQANQNNANAINAGKAQDAANLAMGQGIGGGLSWLFGGSGGTGGFANSLGAKLFAV